MRPRSLGELLDLTFQIYRRRPAFFASAGVAIGLVSTALGLVYSVAVFGLMPDAGADPTGGDSLVALAAMFPMLGVLYLLSWMVYGGFGTFVIDGTADVLLDRGTPGRRIAAAAARKVPRAVWTSFLVALTVGLGLACIVCAALPGIAAWILLVLAIPVAVLEGRPGTAALRRSWELIARRGPAGISGETNWVRVLVVGFVTIVVLYMLNLLASAPVLAATGIAAARGGLPQDTILGPSYLPVWVALPLQVLGAIVQGLFVPLGIIPWTLVYFDIRSRHEGIDIALAVRRLDEEPTAGPDGAEGRP